LIFFLNYGTINCLKTDTLPVTYKNLFPNSQWTQSPSITKINPVMLLGNHHCLFRELQETQRCVVDQNVVFLYIDVCTVHVVKFYYIFPAHAQYILKIYVSKTRINALRNCYC